MKKCFLLLTLGLLIVASCSTERDEPPEGVAAKQIPAPRIKAEQVGASNKELSEHEEVVHEKPTPSEEKEVAFPAPAPVADNRHKDMVYIPAGEFLMGSTREEVDNVIAAYEGQRPWFGNETPQRKVRVKAFYMDRCEVTNSDYKKFVDATGHRVPFVNEPWANKYNWRDGTYPPYPPDMCRYPVVLVSYEDALAYAEWAGKRLPTEAEWEKAARGTDGRFYPWGNEWGSSDCNSAERIFARPVITFRQTQIWEQHFKIKAPFMIFTEPVGKYESGKSQYGCYDMAGNVWEWVSDWYEPYPGSSCKTDEHGQKYRVLRGGSWFNGRTILRCPNRNRAFPTYRSSNFGFRCARDAG